MLAEFSAPEFEQLRQDITAHPRLNGYYLIGLVSIQHLRQAAVPQEAILEKLIEHFDDDPIEHDPRNVPQDQQWSDYEVDSNRARSHTVEALKGGSPIGHTRETMSETTAEHLFTRFVALCGSHPRFYIGLGIGNSQYVYLHGVLIVADNLAGILWIVESD